MTRSFLSDKTFIELKRFIITNLKEIDETYIDDNLYKIINYIDKKNKKLSVKEKKVLTIFVFKKLLKNKSEKKVVIQEQNEYHEKLKYENEKSFYLQDNIQKKTFINQDYSMDMSELVSMNKIKLKDDDVIDFSLKSSGLLMDVPQELQDILDHYSKRSIFNKEIIFIDSRDRNYDIYDSNSYRLNLDKDYNNIYSVYIKNISIPNSDYIINDSNNTFNIQEENTKDLLVTIPVGNYILVDLLNEIETQMNAVGDSDYTISSSTHSVINEVLNTESKKLSQNVGDGWKVFSRSYTDYWLTNSNTNYLIYELPKPAVITRYSVIKSQVSGGTITDWTISISDDKITWTIIDTRSVAPLSIYDFTIANTKSARFVKLDITNTSNFTDMLITKLDFYKDDTTKINMFSDLTGGDNIFTLKFDEYYSLKNILGFTYTEYMKRNTYNSENIPNIDTRDNYIYMKLNDFNKIHFDETSKLRDIFLSIPITSDKNKYTTYLPDKEHIEYYNSASNLSMNKLDISFHRFDNSKINFNGLEHNFIMIIESLNIRE